MSQPARNLEPNVDATLTQGELVTTVVDRWLCGNFSGVTTELKLRVAKAVLLETVIRDMQTCEVAQGFFYRHRYGADILMELQGRFERGERCSPEDQRLFMHLAEALTLCQFFTDAQWSVIQTTADVVRVQLGLSSG